MPSFPIYELSIVKIIIGSGMELLLYFSAHFTPHFSWASDSNRKMCTKLITITVHYNRVSYAVCFWCFICVIDYFYTFGGPEIDCDTMLLRMVYALDYA